MNRSQAHFDRRTWRRRFDQQQRKATVRFGAIVHPERRVPREATGAALVDQLKATALHYRQLAEQTGRPAKRALFIQFAEQREQRIRRIEGRLNNPSSLGPLFDPPPTNPS